MNISYVQTYVYKWSALSSARVGLPEVTGFKHFRRIKISHWSHSKVRMDSIHANYCTHHMFARSNYNSTHINCWSPKISICGMLIVKVELRSPQIQIQVDPSSVTWLWSKIDPCVWNTTNFLSNKILPNIIKQFNTESKVSICPKICKPSKFQKCRFPKMYAEKSSEFNAPSSGGFSLWERSISTISDVKGWRLHQSNSCPSSVANSLLSIMFIYTVLD